MLSRHRGGGRRRRRRLTVPIIHSSLAEKWFGAPQLDPWSDYTALFFIFLLKKEKNGSFFSDILALCVDLYYTY